MFYPLLKIQTCIEYLSSFILSVKKKESLTQKSGLRKEFLEKNKEWRVKSKKQKAKSK
jgi:hypothetical protein